MGDRLDSQQYEKTLNSFSRYSGLRKSFIRQNNLRIELSKFMKELLREKRRIVGRLDSRFTGINKDASGNRTEFDPSMDGNSTALHRNL